MAVVICSNLISGTTGLNKSQVMTANLLHEAGENVTMLNLVGPSDGSRYIMPHWPFAPGLQVYPIQTLPADGGRSLAASFHPVISRRIPNLDFSFSENSLKALAQINRALTAEDFLLFNHPLQPLIYKTAIEDEPRHVPTALQIHGDYERHYPELMDFLRASADMVDALQVVSNGLREQFEWFGSSRVDFMPNVHMPIDLEPTGHSGINLAVVGSFQTVKNQFDAIKMMRQIERPDITLTLWGNNKNSYGRRVQDLAEHYGLESRVKFAGVGTEAQIYSGTDIVVIPSLSEGFGYALVEAASHGIPVVTYDYQHGPRDVVVDGETGFIVPLGDTVALADRVEKLAGDNELRKTMGDASRALFEREFSVDAALSRYRKAIGGAGLRPLSIPELFPVEGTDPVPLKSIVGRSGIVRSRGLISAVTFRSKKRLRAFEVQSRRGARRLSVGRVGGRYTFTLTRASLNSGVVRSDQRVVSYAVNNDANGRFYLANTTKAGLVEVARYLRRDADYRNPDDEFGEAGFVSQGGRLSLPRHPRFPVTSGIDNFGERVSASSELSVRNDGSVERPSVSVAGEFDWVRLYDGQSSRTAQPPYGYEELFSRICTAERSGGLSELSERDVFPWELLRAAAIADLSEALGFWGLHFEKSLPPWDSYSSRKSLLTAPSARRILFEFPRKPSGEDLRTRGLIDEETLVIEYPQIDGYSRTIDDDPMRYPIHEFNEWKATTSVKTPDVDPRPYEAILKDALGFGYFIGDRLTARVRKFDLEREFWRPVFERIRPEEVIIPASYWSEGICQAARDVGAEPVDVQYALTSRLHPAFWFGQRPRHGATKQLSWSEFWMSRTNAYASFGAFRRYLPGLTTPAAPSPDVPHFDICVISQPRVSRRMFAFLAELSRAQPTKSIVLAPHPDERSSTEAKIHSAGLSARISVAETDTLTALRHAEVVVGCYSTSLYEAAALGKPTYVLPFPGHEIVAEDVVSGLFKMVTTPDELEPFEVPPTRFEIFDTRP